MKTFIVLIFAGSLFLNGNSRERPDIRPFFERALQSSVSYENLQLLCETTGGRISGTAAAQHAVELTRKMLEETNPDTVYLQEMRVIHWSRGDVETARISSQVLGTNDLTISALGMSVGTGVGGLKARVVEVLGVEELKRMNRNEVEGKIVFFNRPVDQRFFNTFSGYGSAVDQRVSGPSVAAGMGAVAVLVRSVTTANHDFAHTGVTRRNQEGKNIPAVALSPVGADLLSDWLKHDPYLNLFLETHCELLPEEISYNVIGEIRGSVFPDQIMTVGGHLDAWDNSPGAHDNGGGCMQSIEVLRLFRELNIRPKRTLRAVMFMDEEIDQRGGRKYAELAGQNNEKHYFAIESDRGVASPTGFSIDASDHQVGLLTALRDQFEVYGVWNFFKGGSGVDIGFLKSVYPEVVLVGLVTDPQRYFDYHHSANDTFDKVNRREMQLGSATMAALIYLVDHLDLFNH
jgi:carboxypeptidase Q